MLPVSANDDFSGLAPPPVRNAQEDLGQEDFLTLMITQFQNQDPFEPLDNGAFLGQLAQFSTVNGIDSLNASFAGLSGALQNEQALQAANLVGQSVLAATDTGYLADGGTLRGGIELDSSASNVQVDIIDQSGQLVQRLDLGERAPGTVRFSWDGHDASGEQADTGHYRIEARVVRGANVESTFPFVEAQIESVTLGLLGQDMTLNLQGGEELSLNQVYQII